MATNIITELDQQLASLHQLKPPGANKTKIATITTLCVGNIQAESNIVQSLYRALKKAPATHKLGALYVIDSVVRQWIEKAKQNGQDLNIEGRGEPGTYPAAVKRVTELLPALFDDMIKGIPQEQKPKLGNLVAIWEKGSTFPAKLLAEFRQKLNDGSAPTNGSAPVAAPVVQNGGKFQAPVPSRPLHTPLGYPPQQLYEQGLLVRKSDPARSNGMPAPSQPPPPPPQVAPPAPPAQDVNSILAALANAAPQSAPTPSQPVQQPPQAPAPPQTGLPQTLPPELVALLGQQNGIPLPFPPQSAQPQAPIYSAPSAPPAPVQMPGFQVPQGFPGYPPQPPPSIPQQYAMAPPPPQAPPADPLGPLRGILPPTIVNDQRKLVMALSLLQDLQKQGLPMDQWAPVLKAFDDSQPSTNDLSGVDQYSRRRSRSPTRAGGRGSPVYGKYEDMAAKDGHADDRGRGGKGGRYRQRSPPLRMVHDMPSSTAMNGHPMQPKFIGYDSSLPHDHIKVLSRTLFVGGANGSQQEIQRLFERFGQVQTCIANRDKRHAFVKMTTREHALNAKHGVDDLQNRGDREVVQVARQTKWGVGFGPRECCNYQKGESIIPIHKLTDADTKWLMTAEYGGTGGKQIDGGMILEEPDIEIGAGVSSKAMSKRVIPDSGPPASAGNNKRQRGEHDGGDEHRGGGGGGGRGKKHHHKKHHNDYDRDVSGYGGGPGTGAAGVGGYSGVTGGVPMWEAHAYTRQPEPVAVATPPAVPTFGFSLPGVPGQQYR